MKPLVKLLAKRTTIRWEILKPKKTELTLAEVEEKLGIEA